MKPNSEAKPLPPPSSKNGAAEARLNSEAVAVDLIELHGAFWNVLELRGKSTLALHEVPKRSKTFQRKAFGTFWNALEALGNVLGTFGSVWKRFGPFWERWGAFGNVWERLGTFGTSMERSGTFGSVCAFSAKSHMYGMYTKGPKGRL